METERNEKVLAMYQAVWKLLDEGNDIHKIKVSDITERAGIGKGTAYEYFRSKDEIVNKAMKYNCSLQFQMLRRRIREQDSYRKVLEACFDWMSETQEKRQIVMQFLRQSGNFSKEEGCLCSGSLQESISAVMFEVLNYVVQLGRKEGMVRADLSERLAAVQILSQLLGFFACQEIPDFADKADIAETKAFLCDNIIKSLR